MDIQKSILAGALILGFSAAGRADNSLNPRVRAIVDAVSEARISSNIAKLVSFGTRNTMSSQTDPKRGVGAARQWILEEFRSYSPRLQVRFDKYRVKKQGERIFKDVDLYNVVAVLPGTRHPETQILVTAHYDSLNLGETKSNGSDTIGEKPAMTLEDAERNADWIAPGACDDGSGVAAVMELARVMSGYEFDKTLVFVAFAGEEQGLFGSSLMSSKARSEGQIVEAVLNNDIIGSAVAGDGRGDSNTINVYSDSSLDSVSQQLSRYVREVAERYIPSMHVRTVFMPDRLGRGGDHTPFQWEGYSAVRFSTPNEDFSNEHHATDTLENMSVPYTARVARINAAILATLAQAPKPPIVTRERKVTSTDPEADRRPLPMIARGAGYDAALEWKPDGSDANIKGYAVVLRAPASPYWEREIFVGKTTKFTLKDVSVDDTIFGVRAVADDGSESLVSPYIYPARLKRKVQTVE
jgi:hypothetical protein